jgi:NAD(P)H-dependent flavin oxidoreductase YrpB (nitropropane dioxygenase family)
MAGGPSGPALVAAVSDAGGLGFAAAGYKTPDALEAQLREVRSRTALFGVNVFVPNPLPVDRAEFRAYADRIAHDAAGFGLDLSGAEPKEDDDAWAAKIDLLLADPVPVVSFTFGLPEQSVITALRSAGTAVVLTVTSVAEAAAAAELGPDALAVQSHEAGGHYGTFTPRALPEPLALPELLRAVSARVGVPLIGAGGVATREHAHAALAAGAQLVAVGTALLLTDECEASTTYRSALADPAYSETVVARAFTGRPARGLVNSFTAQHLGEAPFGYPAIHHLTSPMRKAAAAAGDADRINLWAGVNHRLARRGPAANVIAGLV